VADKRLPKPAIKPQGIDSVYGLQEQITSLIQEWEADPNSFGSVSYKRPEGAEDVSIGKLKVRLLQNRAPLFNDMVERGIPSSDIVKIFAWAVKWEAQAVYPRRKLRKNLLAGKPKKLILAIRRLQKELKDWGAGQGEPNALSGLLAPLKEAESWTLDYMRELSSEWDSNADRALFAISQTLRREFGKPRNREVCDLLNETADVMGVSKEGPMWHEDTLKARIAKVASVNLIWPLLIFSFGPTL
jgi:hypothetical protein